MRRYFIALLLTVACAPSGGSRPDDLDALRSFVGAWTAVDSALARTVTGADSTRLVETLHGIREGGVVRSELVRASRVSAGEDSFEGVVALHFADEAVLELTVRATVKIGRILAESTAVSTQLTEWEPLRIEEFGAPARGKILFRGGGPLAEGPKGGRVAVRTALAPAISLIDEALNVPLGGRLGRRLLAGEPPSVIAESAPADGEEIATSLDDVIQAAAEETLGASSGALIAVDPRTGGVRALVSNPEKAEPNRSPASYPYSPGSTFKIVTAAAALEGEVFDIDDVLPCPRRILAGERQVTNFENLDYGPLSFERAFAVSCNTAFAQIGMTVGTDRLLRTAQGLGFSVEDSGPATISIPRSRGELAVRAFGADGILVSPLHMAEVVSTVARGGTRVPVGWIDRPASGKRALDRDSAAALVTMMEETVLTGTGRNAAVPGAKIAGKTGTADPAAAEATGSGARRPDAWFVALAPSRGTRLVVVAFLPGGGVGGESAALMVREFLIATETLWNG